MSSRLSGRAVEAPAQRTKSTHKAIFRLVTGREVTKLKIALWVLFVLWAGASTARPDSLDDIYTTRAVVTGKDERNRPLGFRLCFEDVLVKVTGDPSVVW